eukprot:scaffold5395_cov19-Tisochrysis_lutea.AAC.1
MGSFEFHGARAQLELRAIWLRLGGVLEAQKKSSRTWGQQGTSCERKVKIQWVCLLTGQGEVVLLCTGSLPGRDGLDECLSIVAITHGGVCRS